VSTSEVLAKLVYPKSSQIFVDSAPKTWVRFSWRLFSSTPEPLALTILQNGKVFFRENINGSFTNSVELPPGRYKWFLARPSAGFGGSNVSAVSVASNFEVRSEQKKDLIALIKSNISGKDDISFLLNDW
jgi:hypothetical protein